MYKQLKKVFPSIVKYEQLEKGQENYAWFVADNKEIIGIDSTDLTEKDMKLLSTFLKRYHPLLPEKTAIEEYWLNLIHKKSSKKPKHAFRFIFFNLSLEHSNPTLFKEAIIELFQKQVPILWENETTGILIEEIPIGEEKINYEQIIDILTADLSVQIKFYIGDIQQDDSRLPEYYRNLITGGKRIFDITDKKVIYYIESIPYLLLQELSPSTKEDIVTSILKGLRHDEDMLRTIELYFENNLNVSETAKKMYMHRNSLQYRIDKFINETGINIQRFDEAVVAKFALLANKK